MIYKFSLHKTYTHAFAGLVLAITAFTCVNAETTTYSGGVPKSLFGVELGKTYRVPNKKDHTHGDIPVRRMTGANKFLGVGVHFYFQPLRTYKEFPFVERREKPKDKYFPSSFRLYLLPVIPTNVKTLQDFENSAELEFEVMVIEWRETSRSNVRSTKKVHEDYFWAKDLCDTFEADLGVKPEVLDVWYSEKESQSKSTFYSCTFEEGDRRLMVNSSFGPSVTLNFQDEFYESKNTTVETQLHKLRAADIRPY